MSIVINTNVDALRVQNILANATNKLAESMQRMSSGMRINSAKDDASGCVISARMNVQLTGNQICQQNIQNANALLATSEGNIDVVLDNVSRIRDLTLQAKNGTYSNEELEAMQKEIDERIQEIDRVSKSAKHSQLSLFNDDNLSTNGITFQVGQNADIAEEGEELEENNVIKASKNLFKSVEFSQLTGTKAEDGTVTGTEGPFNLENIKANKSAGEGNNFGDFNSALSKLDDAIDDLTARKALIGAAQSRLTSALDTLTTQYTNLSSANSIIQDADVASEASKFTQNNILQQVATSLLAQANQTPSIALSLI